MKIIVVSDNHGKDCLNEILHIHKGADMFIHCGDSEQSIDELQNFISVRGNNDYYDFDMHRLMKLLNYKILILHGHHYLYGTNKTLLIEKAKEIECNIVFFGHTHIFEHSIIDNIHFINPGSLNYNRDGSRPCYAEVILENNNIRVRKVYL